MLTYPKPLTISRHTVQAVKTPLLSRRERIGLIVQSRLHSRSGRRFAMVIAKLRMPAATINAVVQFLVPPPKYHVERLVPSAKIAPEAQLAALVVIQRGGLGDVDAGARRGARDPAAATARTPTASRRTTRSRASCTAATAMTSRPSSGTSSPTCSSDIPATLLRSETMDWCDRLPAVMENVQRDNGQWRRGAKVRRSDSPAALPIRELEAFPRRAL